MRDRFEEYSGRVNLQLEVHPGMLSDQVRGQLKEMSNDVLHLEAGIQSLNQDVLTLSTRLGSLEDSLDGLKFLCSLDNMEVHTDLIAGLPGYSYEMLYQDVIKLAELNAGEIQLELLKLLPETKMRRESDKLGLKYSPLPPYEVLCSDRMSVADLMKSRKLSRILDFYYNNEVWQTLFRDFIIRDHSFLSDFMDYISDDILEQPLSLEKRGLILFEYCKLYKPEFLPEVKIAWILGGLSVSKEPAQDMKAFIEETDSVKVISGEKTKMMRFYSLDNYVFGFDRAIQRQKPIFFATIK